MIPTPDELQEISLRAGGSLRDVSFAVLLKALALRDLTGVLEIRRRQMVKEVVFENGVPVDCRSNLVHETLGRFMVARGKLTPEDLEATSRESIRRGVRLGEVLRDRGLIDASELFRLLQQNLAKKLLDGFTWSDGGYRLCSGETQIDSPLKVRVPQLILTGVVKFAPQAEVNAGVWPLVGRRLGLIQEPELPLGRLKLERRQRRVLERLLQPCDLGEAAQTAELAFDEVTRLVYALAILGAVAPLEDLPGEACTSLPEWAHETSQEPPAAAAASTRETFGEALDDAQARSWRDRVMEAYLAHRAQDAFDLLQLPEDASPDAARAAYLAFAHRYAPWRYRSPQLAAVAEEAQDLFCAGARAFAELMDSEQRNTLLYRRKVLAEESPKKPASELRIQTDLLDSDKQFQRGRALFDAGKLREALELLEFASDCDPQNALYRAEVAYCRYLLDPASRGEAALEELAEALRIDAACGLAAFYGGEICRELGELERAETLLRRANQLMAPDRRPIEALKALARQQK